MKKVFIVGGDGFARECYLNLTRTLDYGKKVTFGGFLGHGGYGHTVDYKTYQHLYIGEVSEHTFKDDEYCIIGAGYPKLRRKIYEDLKTMGAKFYTLVGRNVVFSESFEYAEANIFVPPFLSSVNIKIGCANVFNSENTVGHDCTIGDFNFFAPRTVVLGEVKVGDDNTFGTNSILLPKTKVGNNNKLAPLSVIYKGCKNNCYMQGNPALKIGEVE